MSISALKEKFNSLTLESENHWDYRGNNNSERDYVHGFCTYPAMMVPKMQREMLDVCLEHLQDTSIRLLDPFAGSGTILVEGMLRGLNIVGIDINPLAILLCKAKTTILNPTTLHEKTVQLFAWITIHDKTPLYKLFANKSFLSGGADITAEDAKAAYEYLEGVDSNMKKFDSIEIAISFPVRRIARLNELTISILWMKSFPISWASKSRQQKL